jgi:hypothetical protein
MPHHRFLVPIIPLLAFPVSTALTWSYKPVVEKVIVILVVLSIGFETYMILSVYKPLSHEFAWFTGGLIQAGQWIDSNTDESATIAVVDAGALAYYGERRTIDILGLNDSHIAHKKGNSDTDYVLNIKPEIIQLHVGFNQIGDLILPKEADHNLSIIYHPEFIECYKPDSKRPDNPFYPYLFLRVCD